jgi:DNA-directed RNA polymerase specialized sigma24 family protein
VNAPGDQPEAGEAWDAAWLEFHATWRPRLRAFLTSLCGADLELADLILRESLLEHRRRWATLDDLDLAHLVLFTIVLARLEPHVHELTATPHRTAVLVLHDLVELPVEDIAAIQRTSEQVVRMHLALAHDDPDHADGFALAPEEVVDVDLGVELLHTAYENLATPSPAAPDDDPETDYALGLVCEQQGDLRGAALCFQRATAYDFEDAADRFVAVLAHLRLPSRGRHARHALREPPPAPPADHERLAIEALVITSEQGRAAADSLPAEQRAICGLCHESRAVAEVAARLSVPLGVARELVGDLATDGMVVVHQTAGADGPPYGLMERVLAGLRGP